MVRRSKVIVADFGKKVKPTTARPLLLHGLSILVAYEFHKQRANGAGGSKGGRTGNRTGKRMDGQGNISYLYGFKIDGYEHGEKNVGGDGFSGGGRSSLFLARIQDMG